MYVVELDSNGKITSSYFKELAPANILYYNYLRYYSIANNYNSDDADMDALFDIGKIFSLHNENQDLEVEIPCIGRENDSVRISLKKIDVSEYIVTMKVAGELPIRVFAPDEATAMVEADKLLKYQNFNMLAESSSEITGIERVSEQIY